MRTHVTFRASRFDASAPAQAAFDTIGSFVAAPGRELVDWLRGELARAPGLVVERPVQGEWGWGLTVRAGEQAVAVHAGLLSDRAPAWLIVARPVVSLRQVGRVDQRGLERIIETLHELLARAPEIDEIGWHEAGVFDRGVMDPSPTPFTPSPPERA